MTSDKNNYTKLVPDYLQDMLEPEEKDLFEKELAMNPELQEELDEFITFRNIYREINDEVFEPSDSVFTKITESIDAVEQATQRVPQAVPHVSSLSGKIQEAWAWLKESISIPWSMAVIQAAVIALLLLPGTPQDSYKTLSVALSKGVSSNILLNIVFKDSATESEIRELLLATNGTITSGPSPQGRYVIALAPGKPTTQVIETIQQSDIVIFVEKAF